jgi:predicted RNA binding protein YcfA (HicA-like mRNA interferase family)
MSKLEKLVALFLREPPDISVEEVISVLKEFGYSERSVVGSHHTFVKLGARPITVPTTNGRRVKKVYIKRIIELLGLEEWYEQQH